MSIHFFESSEKIQNFLITQISKNDYTDFSSFSMHSNLCNHFLIGVIGDFWTFSEISLKIS
jgi:hypothetical protein